MALAKADWWRRACECFGGHLYRPPSVCVCARARRGGIVVCGSVFVMGGDPAPSPLPTCPWITTLTIWRRLPGEAVLTEAAPVCSALPFPTPAGGLRDHQLLAERGKRTDAQTICATSLQRQAHVAVRKWVLPCAGWHEEQAASSMLGGGAAADAGGAQPAWRFGSWAGCHGTPERLCPPLPGLRCHHFLLLLLHFRPVCKHCCMAAW